MGEDYSYMRAIFDELASIYFISKERGDILFLLAEREEISSITRYDDYLVATRALDFQERFGTPVVLSEDITFALNCKWQGLRSMRKFVLDCGKQPAATKIKVARELGSERRETVRSLSIVGVGYLRGAVLSTRGPGWTYLWCTSCCANSIAG